MTDDANATRLGAATIPHSEVDDLTHNDVTSYRAVANQRGTADKLGPLKDLPGFWEGTGFSLIARPDFSGSGNGFFLELNWLRETIEFTTIGSPVFNRGSRQADIAIYGLTYLHRVTDGTTGGALTHRAGPVAQHSSDHRAEGRCQRSPARDDPARQRGQHGGLLRECRLRQAARHTSGEHSALRHRRQAAGPRHEEPVRRI